MVKKGLGRGLGALIDVDEPQNNGVLDIKITNIEPNNNQPRKYFDDEKLNQLAESVKTHGVVQPIIVRKEGDIYRIIAGERRWRAARLAGLDTVPAIVKDVSNKQLMEMALIENIQREDLNPIEEAEAFNRLMKEFSMTQEQLSATVGKSRSAIANSVRLLALCEDVKKLVETGELSNGHARALLAIENKDIQLKLATQIIERNLSVRETESLIKRILTEKKEKSVIENKEIYSDIEDKLKNIFGTKVKLISNNKKGKILIEYYSNEELDRILDMVEKIPNK
jgi:ParB-like partition proteins